MDTFKIGQKKLTPGNKLPMYGENAKWLFSIFKWEHNARKKAYGEICEVVTDKTLKKKSYKENGGISAIKEFKLQEKRQSDCLGLILSERRLETIGLYN